MTAGVGYNDYMIVDTHCHIHDPEFYPDSREEVYRQARAEQVAMFCVGTDDRSSREAVRFAGSHEGCWAIVGVHPHDSREGWREIEQILAERHDIVIGIGEIGLDYYYENSPRDIQKEALRAQLALAVQYDLPVSFHVRDAFDDFWPIFDEFPGIRGVLHSFTDTAANLERALERGLYIGVNGISTFTKDPLQRKLYAELPLEHTLLETDAPFLTPSPFRGKMNVPAYVRRVAEFQAEIKRISVENVAQATTQNAERLFGVNVHEQTGKRWVQGADPAT